METTKTPLSRTLIAGGMAALVVATAVGAYAVDASDHEGERPDREAVQAIREAARTALEANDYDAWAAALADAPKAAERVNEDTFNILYQAFQLKESGDVEAAKTLLQENDIRPHKHRGERPELTEEERAEREARREAVRAAVTAGDYAAWSEVLADAPHAEEFVTQENFDVLVEASALRESGDNEAARELLQANDIRRPGKHGHRGAQR